MNCSRPAPPAAISCSISCHSSNMRKSSHKSPCVNARMYTSSSAPLGHCPTGVSQLLRLQPWEGGRTKQVELEGIHRRFEPETAKVRCWTIDSLSSLSSRARLDRLDRLTGGSPVLQPLLATQPSPTATPAVHPSTPGDVWLAPSPQRGRPQLQHL